MATVLCEPSFVVRQQCGSGIQVVSVCRVIHVLVCRKLDSNKHVKYTSARSAGSHSEKDDLRTKTP